MEINLFKPTDHLLKPFIECFYTLKRDPLEAPTRYAAFPSIYSMVCMNANCTVTSDGNDLSFRYDETRPHQLSLICDFESPGMMNYEGAMDEIVIYFKPLAINAFLERPLNAYLTGFCSPFAPFDDYTAKMNEIFSIKDDSERIAMLEAYWRSKFRGFEHPFLHEVVEEMISGEFRGSVSELAARYGVSRTTLIKHFTDQVCTTPSQFKKVVRFRGAMKQHRNSLDDTNLADISYVAEYFDQSHMIKDFRSLTRLSPKTFFSRLSTLEDGHINWLFAS